jgi:16S rRNA (uracil1498-N3)-methyltransferase
MARADYEQSLASHPPRFYASPLAPGQVALTDDQAHHARNVLRLKAGDAVELFDGAGVTARGVIDAIGRAETLVTVEACEQAVERPEPVIELAFAVPKGKRLDWLLEKATELGAAILQPVVFARSVAGGAELSAGKRQRWLGHCISAAKQCRTDFLPDLREPISLDRYLAGRESEICLVGDVDPAGPSLAGALATWQQGQRVSLIVGPEGDFTSDEWQAMMGSGVTGVRLGSNVLRVETAAVALLAGVVAVCDVCL